MRNFIALLFAALAAAMLCSPASHAQPIPNALPAPESYSDFYAALEAGVDQQLVLDTTLSQLATQMVQGDPMLRELEKNAPGVVQALMDAMRPGLFEYSERIRLEYRPRIIAEIRQVLTAREAMAMSAFYRSPLGLRTLQSASTNFSITNAGQQAIDGVDVTSQAINSDISETAQRGYASLSAEDRAELDRVVLTTPGFHKLPIVMQRIGPIRAEMENAQPTAGETAAIEAALLTVVQQYTGQQ